MPADQLALVTGTSSGIGHATAEKLLERGWRVLGVARRAPAITHEAYEHVRVDLSDLGALSRALEAHLTTLVASRAWKRIGLVNNAADPGLLGPVARFDANSLGRVFATNVTAPIWLMGAFVRHTPPSAALRIVNVSSRAAVLGISGLGGYGASKAALRMAGMVLAAEIDGAPEAAQRERRITILSYEPGTVDTPMQANARSLSADILPSVALFAGFAAEGRLASPAAPAGEIVSFLESDSRVRFLERRYGT